MFTVSNGINKQDGTLISEWRHVEQSILDIFTTRVGTRVMRRDYGSDIPDLIDRPQNKDLVLEVALAAGVALDKWEPRFRLRGLGIESAGPDGRMSIDLVGDYFPRGHLGDFTIVETDREFKIRI
jgi:phage baseplate assembly protein W